jgi:imidazole glycerol-phosphate synthase subunit HisH
VLNMFKRLGIPAIAGSDAVAIEKATKLILPGVGAFDTCAQKLHASGLQPLVHNKVITDKIPVLGICVGMQLMTEGSEEGVLPGLAWVKGRTVKFKPAAADSPLKIPHMGWAEVAVNKPSRLLEGMYPSPRFYFTHSYYTVPANTADTTLFAVHGQPFTAAFECGNIAAVQFHPEKSHKYGMKLLENFANYF